MDSKQRLQINSHFLCEKAANLLLKRTNETLNTKCAMVRKNGASCSSVTANNTERVNHPGLLKTDEPSGSAMNPNINLSKLFADVMERTKSTCDGFKEMNVLFDDTSKKAPAANRLLTKEVPAPKKSPQKLSKLLVENRQLKTELKECNIMLQNMKNELSATESRLEDESKKSNKDKKETVINLLPEDLKDDIDESEA